MEYKRLKKGVVYFQEDDETESDSFCNICGKPFQSKSSLKDHIDRVHKKIKNYQCPYCAHPFFKQTDLNRHIKRKHAFYTAEISNSSNIESQDNLSLYDSVNDLINLCSLKLNFISDLIFLLLCRRVLLMKSKWSPIMMSSKWII